MSLKILMESIKNRDSIDVFRDVMVPLGSIELDQQGSSQFYASPFSCTVLYRINVPLRKMSGKNRRKNKKDCFLFYIMYYDRRFLNKVFFRCDKPVPDIIPIFSINKIVILYVSTLCT